MQKTNAIRLLDQQKIKYDTIEYEYDEDNLSVEKIAIDNNLDLNRIFKTLVCVGNTGEIVVALVSGDAQLSNKKLATLAGLKKIDLAPVKDLQTLTGYIRGGCSPLGMKKQFRIFANSNVQDFDWVYVNAGRRGLLFGCSPQDLVAASGAVVADITS
jgi:Cys-tRNA(Pro)/Cys-tRNA(Cys) deacylase